MTTLMSEQTVECSTSTDRVGHKQCPFCDTVPETLFKKNGIGVCQCRRCGHRFADWQPEPDHVAEVYDDDYFFGGGAGYQDYLSEADMLRAHGKRYAKLLEQFTQPGMMFDVGAAAGLLMQGFQECGWQVAGVEPNPSMAAHAREELQLAVATGSLEEFDGDEQFDLVSLIQVVAHFVDPLCAFQAVERLTKPGGYCLIETWDVGSWTARLCGRHWHEYSPPSVLQWYTPKRLAAALSTFGFREIKRGHPRKWLNGEHAKSLLQYKFDDMPGGSLLKQGLRLIPDRLTIPYPSEDVFWAIYRKDRSAS